MIRVLVADDHALVRQSIASLLRQMPDLDVHVVAEVGRGDDALRLILELAPDIAVLDISMPGLDGLTIGLELRRRQVAVPIIYVTMHRDRATAQTARQLGARGYVLKDEEPAVLLAAFRAVAAGHRHFSVDVDDPVVPRAPHTPEVQTHRLLDLATGWETRIEHTISDVLSGGVLASPAQCAAYLDEVRRNRKRQERELAPFQALSGREAIVLDGLVQGFSAETIAARSFVSVATVRSQIRSVLRKLGVHTQLAAVAAARRAGWALASLDDVTSGRA